MDSPEFTDPYLIPQSNVLRNLVGAATAEALAAAEADLSFARALQLLDSPVAGNSTGVRSTARRTTWPRESGPMSRTSSP